MQQNSLFIVGDVHGCYHTFRSLVESYWQPDSMNLIQLGDLTDRGKYIPETIQFARELEEKFAGNITFLMGNHEAMVLEFWHIIKGISLEAASSLYGSTDTLYQYFKKKSHQVRCADDMSWLRERPLFWQNNHVFVSHAGISNAWNSIEEACDIEHSDGILWTRSTLKNLGKVQVIGHTPIKSGQPEFRPKENCWNIDTGAVFGLKLTALHVAFDGTLLNTFSMATHRLDI